LDWGTRKLINFAMVERRGLNHLIFYLDIFELVFAFLIQFVDKFSNISFSNLTLMYIYFELFGACGGKINNNNNNNNNINNSKHESDMMQTQMGNYSICIIFLITLTNTFSSPIIFSLLEGNGLKNAQIEQLIIWLKLRPRFGAADISSIVFATIAGSKPDEPILLYDSDDNN
ncbi:hypothetical protein ACJX0J_032474, partial [Zea mays]